MYAPQRDRESLVCHFGNLLGVSWRTRLQQIAPRLPPFPPPTLSFSLSSFHPSSSLLLLLLLLLLSPPREFVVGHFPLPRRRARVGAGAGGGLTDSRGRKYAKCSTAEQTKTVSSHSNGRKNGSSHSSWAALIADYRGLRLISKRSSSTGLAFSY